MSKVMVSIPDDLLAILDAEAERRRTTRSGLLRNYVREGMRQRARERARRVEEIVGEPGHHAGTRLADLKAGRP